MAEDFIISRKATKKEKIPKKTRVIVNVILSVVLAFSLLFDAAAFGLMIKPTETTGGSKVEMEDVVKSNNKDVTYFLVVGTDEGSTLTDIMMLVCLTTVQRK